MVECKLWWMSPGNLPDWQPLENLTFGALAAGIKVSPRPDPSLPELTDPVQSLRNTSGRDGAQGHGFLRREPESYSGSMSSYHCQLQSSFEAKFLNAAKPCLQSAWVSPKIPDLTNGDVFPSAESDSSISRRIELPFSNRHTKAPGGAQYLSEDRPASWWA